MKREAQETNKTVVAELKLEAPFSAKHSWGTSQGTSLLKKYPTFFVGWNWCHWCQLKPQPFDNLVKIWFPGVERQII
ncbi:hypothetical protein SAMD00079811_72390 [Scytonema sp. HK-05]|uniref:hypothetical protein n=1 Tax=Scytonema sp. HK-05 TaxID=1137095 RepID=UPI000936CD02|nr:hypothetical protein [Scytonema sp. HK-05]OKH47969.1 hypothetical protein NIES2130_35635 [Scytonema sp. HK-05]BAY49610.1 hypothetical protein SAMD00079811_72390 [Scytonema sp. HK-05]